MFTLLQYRESILQKKNYAVCGTLHVSGQYGTENPNNLVAVFCLYKYYKMYYLTKNYKILQNKIETSIIWMLRRNILL